MALYFVTVWPLPFSSPFLTKALDGNFVKVLYIIKFQSVRYLSVKYQVDRPGNKEVTIYPIALSE